MTHVASKIVGDWIEKPAIHNSEGDPKFDPSQLPPPPPLPDAKIDFTKAKDLGGEASDLAARRTGMAGTILTSPQGLSAPALTGQKTLLGQ